MNSFTRVLLGCLVLLVLSANGARAQASEPTWDRYHNSAEAFALLEGWAREYPGLTNLYSIGETLEGTPLWMLEITNKETGDALAKPGYYYDGNIHAGELTAAEVALHFAWYNFVRIHQTLRVTPAMEAGITERVWGLYDLVA